MTETNNQREIRLLKMRLRYYQNKTGTFEKNRKRKKMYKKGERQIALGGPYHPSIGVRFTEENYAFIERIRGNESYGAIVNAALNEYRRIYKAGIVAEEISNAIEQGPPREVLENVKPSWWKRILGRRK